MISDSLVIYLMNMYWIPEKCQVLVPDIGNTETHNGVEMHDHLETRSFKEEPILTPLSPSDERHTSCGNPWGEDVCEEAHNLGMRVKGVLEGFPEVWEQWGRPGR